MRSQKIHVVGFGSQGSAWAQCLRTSGWDVQIYLSRKEKSYWNSIQMGFKTSLLHELPGELSHSENSGDPHLIAMLCPDSEVAKVYSEYLANLSVSLRLILAHGFAMYSQDLKLMQPNHSCLLLAPKAIGPKLQQHFEKNFPAPHSLVAAFFSEDSTEVPLLKSLGKGIGFKDESLVWADFSQETIGDLISEQGLLCGGTFNLLLMTAEAMIRAGIPPELVREECITELELIAGMLREKGPGQTFRSISQAAQCGTVTMSHIFQDPSFKKEFQSQCQSVQNKEFANTFRKGDWQKGAESLQQSLDKLEKIFKHP